MLLNYFSSASAESLLREDDTLAVLKFQQQTTQPIVPVLLENLDSTSELVEVWKAPNQKVERGKTGECYWSRSEDILFTSIVLPYNDGDDLQQISETAYTALLNAIQDSDYPQLVRFWNIIPNINHGAGDNENYRRFCTSRLDAFSNFQISDEQFPAATAVGHYGTGISVYALSAKQTPHHISNPRQVNPFRYPRQYGPSSPSFARATTLSLSEAQDCCFISGTASILGHETVHVNDLNGQLHTTNDNILYLLKEAGFDQNHVKTGRVYIRHPEHFEETKKVISNWFANAEIVYTHADICRSDLLIEVECFCVND